MILLFDPSPVFLFTLHLISFHFISFQLIYLLHQLINFITGGYGCGYHQSSHRRYLHDGISIFICWVFLLLVTQYIFQSIGTCFCVCVCGRLCRCRCRCRCVILYLLILRMIMPAARLLCNLCSTSSSLL